MEFARDVTRRFEADGATDQSTLVFRWGTQIHMRSSLEAEFKVKRGGSGELHFGLHVACRSVHRVLQVDV